MCLKANTDVMKLSSFFFTSKDNVKHSIRYMTFTRGSFVEISQVNKLRGTYIEDMIKKKVGKLYHKHYGPPM